MLFRHVSLSLNQDDFPYELVMPFGFQTRAICNFLERRVRAERFPTAGFRGLFAEGSLESDRPCAVVAESALLVPVAFDRARYESLVTDELNRYFVEMLRGGIAKSAADFGIPADALRRGLDDFERSGCINEWIHQHKLLRPVGLRATLCCRLDTQRFQLTLQLDHRGERVFDETILETKPDEIIFSGQFRDVVLTDDAVVVTDKYGDATFSLPLANVPLNQRPR
jgi:hypothetical protein